MSLLMSVGLCACAARYHLLDTDIDKARLNSDGTASLYVYPSNRTIILYDRDDDALLRVGKQIDIDQNKERLKRPWTRQTGGAIVDEDLSNGARRIWVSFELARCSTRECAMGFVQTEDGKYRLHYVPEIEYYKPPMVHRGCVLKKHRMKVGNMKSLTEANKVYRLKRRKKAKTVFLEVKIDRRKRRKTRTDRFRGRN
jgi:hypothetical protein